MKFNLLEWVDDFYKPLDNTVKLAGLIIFCVGVGMANCNFFDENGESKAKLEMLDGGVIQRSPCLKHEHFESIRSQLNEMMRPAVSLWVEALEATLDDTLLPQELLRKQKIADQLKEDVTDMQEENNNLVAHIVESCQADQ